MRRSLVGVDEAPPIPMDEDEFARFYDATVHPLRAYLMRLAGDEALADDLTQESYCRLLAAPGAPAGGDGRRRYLFRIATNLVHDHHRRPWRGGGPLDERSEPVDHRAEQRWQLQGDVGEILGLLTGRQRALLWLAYVEGMQHREIAEVLGLSALSVRPLLWRARRRMARELRARGFDPLVPPGGD